MKKMKKLSLSLFCILTLLTPSLSVSAGAIIHELDKTSFQSTLDSSQWNDANGDIDVENGCIVFPKESTSDTKLVWKSVATDSGIYEELLSADTTFRFTALPQGERFILAFGLSTIESSSGSTGNVEIAFANHNGVSATVTAYDSEGNAKTILENAKVANSLTQKITVSLTDTVTGVFDLKINGKKLCSNVQLPVTGEGRIGFMQTGNCGAIVEDLHFKIYDYDTPENCDIEEDFNDGSYNANLLNVNLSTAYSYPATASICDYNGEKALRIENASYAHINTVYPYSNFELSFDVLWQKNTNDYDENMNIVKKQMDNFLIRYGCSTAKADWITWETSGYGGQIVVMNSSITHSINKELGAVRAENHLFNSAENEGRGYSLKFIMIDNVLTAQVKWLDEKEYTTVFVSDVGSAVTPSGFIQIICLDGANIVFDNLKVINRDKQPALTEVEYKTNVFREVPDYDYTQQEIKYMDVKQEKEFNWYLIPIAALGVGAVCVGVTLCINLLQRRRSRGGDTHEKN